MKLPSAQLEAFFILSQERNFTKAAKRIGLSQPAFSQRIIALEDYLETTLVVREKQGVMLTEIGKELFHHCNINNQMEQELLSKVKSPESEAGLLGQIRVAGFSSIMRSILIPSLTDLLIKNPKLSIQTFTDELDNIPDYLKSSKADFIITSRSIEKEGIHCRFLGIEENVLVSSKKHKELPIFLDHDQYDQTTDSYFQLLKKDQPKNKRYLNDIYGLLDGVHAGIGKAVLPRHLITTLKNLKVENPKIVLKVPVYLIYHEAVYYTSTQKAVIAEIIKGFQAKLSRK